MSEILSTTTVFDAPHSVFGYNAWPSVTRGLDGELIAVCSGGRMAHVCPFGKVLLSRSYDGGRVWTKPQIIIDTPLDDRDAGITVFNKNRLIVTSFNHYINVQRGFKPDNPQAATLAKAYFEANCAVEADEKRFFGSTYVISDDNGITWSEVKKAPVTAPHGPLALKQGGLLYLGNPWAYAEESKRTEQWNKKRVQAWYSPDGENWTLRGELPAAAEGIFYCETNMCQLSENRIIGHIRVQGDGTPSQQSGIFCIYQTESDDCGATWSEPHRINDAGAPPHLLLHSSGALVCVYGYRKQPYGERAMISRDGGKTWGEPIVLSTASGQVDLGYPCSAELDDASICTVYYQQRESGRFNTVWSTVWKI